MKQKVLFKFSLPVILFGCIYLIYYVNGTNFLNNINMYNTNGLIDQTINTCTEKSKIIFYLSSECYACVDYLEYIRELTLSIDHEQTLLVVIWDKAIPEKAPDDILNLFVKQEISKNKPTTYFLDKKNNIISKVYGFSIFTLEKALKKVKIRTS